MRHFCRRGGFCELLMLGTAPSPSGRTIRLCTKGGELRITDRPALGLPAQVIIGSRAGTRELETAEA